MSLTVEPLNADSTFLLTFIPKLVSSDRTMRSPPDFTILVDPWLDGASSILHPSFQISHHRNTPFVQSLADLSRPPDLILISQDKPDHCHKGTLCSIPSSWRRTNILAPPAAAKKIISWKLFDPQRIHILPSFNADRGESVIRIPVPRYSSSNIEGEITIANVASKKDLTGLHNAIGITYQPASTVLTAVHSFKTDQSNGIVAVARTDLLPLPPSPPPPQIIRPEHNGSRERLRLRASTRHLRKAFKSEADLKASRQQQRARVDSALSEPPAGLLGREPILSLVYSPHGVSLNALQIYADAFLAPLNALPLTALFHSMTVEQNPWFLGGTVSNGAPGGVNIARRLGARNWISAHDEQKDNKGLATMWIRSQRYDMSDVQELLMNAGASVNTHVLDSGNVLQLSA